MSKQQQEIQLMLSQNGTHSLHRFINSENLVFKPDSHNFSWEK